MEQTLMLALLALKGADAPEMMGMGMGIWQHLIWSHQIHLITITSGI
jgi:hypothetical protein